MGVTIHELRAVISGNLVGFSQMVDGAISKTQSLRKAWGDFAADASRAANRIVNTFGLIGGAVTGAAVKMGFGFNSIKEQSEIAFTTMLGDGQKAKKFIAELTEFAARTPFELPGLLDSTKKLMAFGFEAEKIIPMLTVVGDAASGLGNPAAMDFIIRALGQIQAKGKVAAQEMNQLAEQGIPAWQALADKIGVSIPEAMKLAEQGAISSGVAIPAILEGMDAKFRGLMEKQAGSMSGLLSTLMDRLRGWAGDAFLPIYDSIRNGMSKLLSGDSLGMIDGLVRRVQGSMAAVAVELDAMFANDPSAMFAAIGTAVDHAARIFASFVGWLRQSGPAFAETAGYVWEFIEPLLNYLREHPQILAALIALKVTGFLGLNSAVMSLGNALLQTIMSLGRMGGATTTLGSAFKGAGFAAALAAIVAISAAVYEATLAMTGYTKAVEEARKLNQQIDQESQKKKQGKISELQSISDPAARQAAIEKELERAKQSQAGANAMASGAQANAEAIRDQKGYFGYLTGNKVTKEAFAEAEEMKARSEAAGQYRLELERMLAEEKRAVAGGGTSGPASPTSPSAPPTADIFSAPEGAVADIQSQVSPEAQALQDRTEAADNAIENFGNSLAEWEGVISDQVLDGFETSFADLAQQFRDGAISEQEFQMGVAGMNEGLSSVVPFMERLEGMGDTLPTETLQGFENQFTTLLVQLQNGELTANQYQMELGYLNDSMQLAGQGVQNAARFEDQLTAYRTRMAEAGVSLPESVVAGYQSRFAALNQQFASGAISANRFTQATDALQKEMDAAGQAAIKEMQLKERQRLLSGNFTQEEFQKAAEDRIIQMRMQQFDQYVEQAVNNMMGFNNGLQQMGGNLQQFGNNLQQFGNGFGGMQQQFDPEQLRAAQATYNAFARSVQGQMDGIIHEIGLAQQRLSLTSIITGDAIRGQERWSTITWIEELTRQLERLQYSPPPQFVAGLGSFQFSDPGLQSGTQQPNAMTINVNVPNLTRMNNQEVSNLVEAIRREQERRGRQIFGG